MIPLARCLPAPAGAIRCLLCEGIQGVEDEGGTEKYERHLRTEHGVSYNRSWLIEQTLAVTDRPEAVRQADSYEQQQQQGGSGTEITTDVIETKVTDNFVTVEEDADSMNTFEAASVADVDPLDVVSVEENVTVKSIIEVAENVEGPKRRLDRGESYGINSKKPYSCCGEEFQNTEEKKQTHQTVRKLVKSALRVCSVTLRNYNFKVFKDENENLSTETDENCNESELSDSMDPSCSSGSKEEDSPACLKKTRNEPKSVKSAFIKPKSNGIKITETSILFENRTNGFESQEDSTDNASDWFDGNKFSCKKCMFSSTSLNNFSAHVKCYHKTTLAKFSGCYGKTNVQYQCKCCSKKVYHEKSVVKEHVESHLLNLKKYASLYEKGRFKNNSDCNLSAEFGETLNPYCSPSVHQDPSHTSDAPSSPLPSPPTADLPPSNEVTSSHGSDSADKFVYICPFHGCDFQTDLQGMKNGPAAEHGIAVHQVRPWEVKKHGLKWKRMSREKRKRKVCGGD